MHIGESIKTLRKQNDMTLAELSEKSGIALATLSRIENGKMSGTIKAHTAICKSLGVSIAELYKTLEDKNKTVDPIKQELRTEEFRGSSGIKYELLISKVVDKKIMPLLVSLKPSAETKEEKNPREVEKFIYILEGKIEANIGEKNYKLKKGDSLYFDASLPHTFSNPAKTISKFIKIITPPSIAQ